MLSRGIVNASHVAGLLSLIDGVTDAIDVQVAKNKGDLKQEIVILSQLHVINVQQLRDLDSLAVRWDTTDICSICQEECESILIEIEMMQKMGTPVPYDGFPLTNLKFTWKTSRCRFGGRNIVPTKPTSTHSYWKMSNKSEYM
jgi:hypothetical protein